MIAAALGALLVVSGAGLADPGPDNADQWATFVRPAGEDCVKKGTVTLPGVPASTDKAIDIRWTYNGGSMSRSHSGIGEIPGQDWSHTYDVSLNLGIFPEGAFELSVYDDTPPGPGRTQIINVPACVTPPSTPPPAAPVDTPPPTDETPQRPGAQQSVKAPKPSVRKGKSLKVAEATRQGVSIEWKASPRKICRMQKGKVRALKKGQCALSAEAAATPGFAAFSRTFKVKVK